MAHARLQTLPPTGRPGRKSSANTDLLYQTALEGHYRIDRVAGSHTELLIKKCNRCGDKTPVNGFAPVFDEFQDIYHGRARFKRMLLCNDCWWKY